MPASVPQPTGAPDTACRQRRPASPRRCVGCAPYSRVRRQPHGLKDCHTLCPDTGVGVPPRWAVVVRPQWRPGSPPTAWHRARLQAADGAMLKGHALSIHKETCAWYQPCHGPWGWAQAQVSLWMERACPLSMAPSAACHSQSTPCQALRGDPWTPLWLERPHSTARARTPPTCVWTRCV